MQKRKTLFAVTIAVLLSVCACGTQTTVEPRPSNSSATPSAVSTSDKSSNQSTSNTNSNTSSQPSSNNTSNTSSKPSSSSSSSKPSSSSSSSSPSSSSSSSKPSSSSSSSSSSTHTHTPGTAVQENVVAPTCGQDGSYDEVIYCTSCHQELSRTHKTTPATGEHNYVKNPDTLEYVCSVCGAKNGRDYEMNITIPEIHVGDLYVDRDYTYSFKNDDHTLAFGWVVYEIGGTTVIRNLGPDYHYTSDLLGKSIDAYVYIGVYNNSQATPDGTYPNDILTNVDVYANGIKANKVGATIYNYYQQIITPQLPTAKFYVYEIQNIGTVLAGSTATVTWKNYDGTVLETDSDVPVGTTPTYDGATPTRATDETYAYYFKGWDKEISPVNGDITYTATYEQTRFYMSESADGWTVTGLIELNYNGELEVEETLLNKPVIAIAANALNGANNVTSLTIPDTVTSIGDQAFANMSLLAVFTANNNAGALITIGWNIFLGCSSLVSIAIPLYGHIGTLFGTTEFTGATAVTSGGETYYIPNTLKNFKDTGGILSSKAFEGTALTKIEISEQVLYINDEALAGANSLVNLTIPYVGNDKNATEPSFNTLFGIIFSTTTYGTSITYGAHQQYDSSHYNYYYIPYSLKNVTVNGGTFLGYEFSDCNELEKITLNGVTNLANRSFYHCSANVIMNEGLQTIGDHAFYYSDMAGDLVIPDSVTSIGEFAFIDAQKITSFVVGANVETLGKSAFSSCKAAKSITFKGNKITEIQSMTFNHCDALEAIVVPEGVTKINGNAFDYCGSLASVSLPSTLVSLKAASIFSHNDVLTAINYNGTKAMWNAIEKSSNWYSSSQCPNLKTIHCTDGDITL